MKALSDDKLRKLHEVFRQNHSELRQRLMAALPERCGLPKQKTWLRRVHTFIEAAILKSRLTKIAAAVLLLGVATLGYLIFEKSVSSAYAIEQTIDALRAVTTVHVIGTDWSGRGFRAWNKINPQTGKAEWVCIDQTPHGYKTASTPKGSCVWDKDGNIVRRTNRIISTNDFRYAHVFEDLSERMRHPRDDEKIKIYREKDPATGKELVVIWAVTKLKDYKVYIDPVTKLPVRTIYDRADNMQQICKSADQIFYNLELPEGMFDFEIPPEFVRDYSILEDPDKGMPAVGLTQEQASILTVKKYFQAAVAADWDTCQQLAPMDRSWKTGFRKNPPVEVVEVRQPYPERGCTGLIVPCVVRYENDDVYESKAVVNYREIDGRPSCIIVAWWGERRLIE
jgi:hypothetical protein